MKTELKEVSPTQKEIHVEIDAQTVKEAYGKVSYKYARAAAVPGFRKGNAPLEVIRMRFKDEIGNEVLQEIIPKAVSEAIAEHDLNPLAEPQLHLENQEDMKLNGSQPISLHVHVEIMPEIPAPDYKGLELTRRVRPVDDDQIEDLINRRREEQTAFLPVEDRPSEDGDTVIVDLEGEFEGEPDAEPIKADDLEISLGDDQIEKSFSENLIGVSEDEEKEFTVSYPEDFTSPGLAGKTVHYRAKIKSIGRSEAPELNDEWAQSLDEGYESVEDLRGKLRADLAKYAESDADAKMRNEAIAKFTEKHDFEIPSALIDNQARNLLNNFAEDLQQRGTDLTKIGQDFVQMVYQQMQIQAERDVRGALLLEKVAELENVEISDEDVNEELQKMADYYRTTAEEIRSSLEKQQGGTENVRNNLKTRKAIEALVTHATVTEGEWIDESVQPPELAAGEDDAETVSADSAEGEAADETTAEITLGTSEAETGEAGTEVGGEEKGASEEKATAGEEKTKEPENTEN